VSIHQRPELEMYRKILNEILEGVVIYENSGLITWCNQRAASIFAEKTQNLIGDNIKSYLSEDLINNTIFDYFNVQIGGDIKKDYQVKKKVLESGTKHVIFIKDPLKVQTSNNQEITSMPVRKAIHNFEDIIGYNQKICDIKILAKRAANTSSPVLIYGETGTGKELFAQSIHNSSNRSKKLFVAINCAAIPENLLEGILFGTVKGAYTEAIDRPGLFEQASEGTLFLDEINSMPLLLQAKLLRVLQERKIRRVGGMADIEVNPRIISSLNVKPLDAIEKGFIRNDLFYRLGVVCLGIPPLRERIDDLEYLIGYFMKKVSKKLHRGSYSISYDLLKVFEGYHWPGNVRQLEHAIECSITLIGDIETEINIEHIPEYMKVTSTISESPLSKRNNFNPLQSEIEKVEKNQIIAILENTDGNVSHAAKVMNISRQSLHYRMKKYQIRVSR